MSSPAFSMGVSQARVRGNEGRVRHPLATDPELAEMGAAILAALGGSLPGAAEREDLRTWRALMAVGRRHGFGDWARAVDQNIGILMGDGSTPAQRALAGYLLYLMTVSRRSPFSEFVRFVYRGGTAIEMEIEPLIDDWMESDVCLRPFGQAAERAKVGRWWGGTTGGDWDEEGLDYDAD